MRGRPSVHPTTVLLLGFILSLLVYLVVLVLPYNLFAHVHRAPVSLGEISRRSPLAAAAFLLGFGALFWIYAVAYRLCRRHAAEIPAAAVLLSGAALALLLGLTYPIGAGDVVDYVTHGEELAYFGVNPLVVPPAYVEGNLLARYSAFRFAPSNYGPLWTWISALVVGVLGRESLLVNLLGFKAVAVAAYLGQAVLIHAILRRRCPERATAGLLFFAWNPLVLYEFAVNGHNDAMMIFFALLGIFLWERDHLLGAVVGLTLSFLVKIPTLLLLPLLLLAAVGRYGWKGAVRGALVACGLVAVAYASLPDPLAALTNLSTRSGLLTHSLPAVAYLGLLQMGVAQQVARLVVQTAGLLALGGWILSRLWVTWRAPSRLVRSAYETVLFLLLFVTPWFQPWYVTWLVGLAALVPDESAPAQAGLFSGTVMASYVVYGFVWFWAARFGNWANGLGINLLAVATTYGMPWAFAARTLVRQARARAAR